jgi:hypothetical protein
MGNGGGHMGSLAEVDCLIDDETIRILFNALTQKVEDVSTAIQDASFATHNALVGRIPALNVISNLPNPNNGGTASEAEVERVVQEQLVFCFFLTLLRAVSILINSLAFSVTRGLEVLLGTRCGPDLGGLFWWQPATDSKLLLPVRDAYYMYVHTE